MGIEPFSTAMSPYLKLQGSITDHHTPPTRESVEVLAAYATLGVSSLASNGQIRDAYRQMAKTMHPDREPTPEGKAILERKLREVNEAWEAIKKWRAIE